MARSRTAAEAVEEALEVPVLPLNPSVGAAGEALVLVMKGEETIYIHPTTIKAHRELGWKVV
jgi:hypothetical protein